ncbi:hypothetical protein BHE74_00016030 [Ensete ventricosum]|uniref:Uncharacterized protein n=1 Tax=Ensete ventricosum TaxID=4639 RepID=A0A445MCE7_ENSVE|nr:hypothetical protein BHE74_00016030 [Ensete ventricosum]RZR71903.1 hypothetical protein BHM03_00008676 [Ensete ventricosum]
MGVSSIRGTILSKPGVKDAWRRRSNCLPNLRVIFMRLIVGCFDACLLRQPVTVHATPGLGRSRAAPFCHPPAEQTQSRPKRA